MFFGALGGLTEPIARKLVFRLATSSASSHSSKCSTTTTADAPNSTYSKSEVEDAPEPVTVELLSAICFFTCAVLLLIPQMISTMGASPNSFILSLCAFISYEYIVGIYMPCEGLQRSIYMPNRSICSLMTILRVIVNLAVALGVVSTNYIS